MHFEKEVGESLTYKFAQAAGEMRAQGKEIISLGLGEPDFHTPGYVTEATANALKAGFTHYSATQGWPKLRELVAADCNKSYGSAYTANDVIITPGIKAAVYFALASILEPGDEVVMLSPYYVSYPAMVKLAEPAAKIIDVPFKRDFTLDKDALAKAFHKKTKAILLNTPNNPTGMVMSRDETDLVVKLALENDAYIISDEVYEKLVYSGMEHIGLGRYKEVRDRLVVCNGYSKSYAMTGWRLGFAAGPKEVIFFMNKIHQFTTMSANTTSQYAAVHALNNPLREGLLGQMRDEYDKRRDIMVQGFLEMGLSLAVPEGAFYVFPSVSALGMGSQEFCSRLLEEQRVAVIPGDAFGACGEGYIRCSYAYSEEMITKCLQRIALFVKGRI